MRSRTGVVVGATTALVLLTAMNFVNYLDRYILPAVQEQIKHEFTLTDNQIGSLTLWFMVAYVCVSPITGWLGDRFPRKPMIVVAALGIAAMNFLTASVHGYTELNFRHAALGIGEACFGIFAPALLADFYPESKRNKVMTIFNIALPVGAAAGYEAGSWVAAHHGWRMSFISSAVPGVLVALLILFFMREPQRTGVVDKAKTDRATVLSLAKNKAYLTSILGYAAVTFSLGGISWWMPSFLHREAGYSIEAAGAIMGPIIVVAGLGGTALGGWLAQVWSKRTPKALYLVPALSAALTIAPAVVCFFGPQRLIVPSLATAVFLIFLGTGPVNAATLNAVPANLRATAMAGQLFAIHVFGDMPSSKVIGMISDRSNLRTGMAVTLVAFAVGAVIFFVGARFAPPLTDTVEAPAPA
ncbi:MAG TPA: MFS transporter [Acidobacteriaceae bacterium]|nr:MFS transporter [Acidobacteriaceae bacterium]